MLQVTNSDNVKCRHRDAKQATDKIVLTQLQTETAYAIRKERKRLLLEQAESMQEKLDKLKFRLMVKQGQIEKVTKRTVAENAVLHEYVQEQHIMVATTQASLMGHVLRSLGAQQPAQSVIHLGTDRQERFSALVSLKDRKLYEAERYLVARSRGFVSGIKYCQEESFETIDGDSYFIRFEAIPIRGASVKAVFDVLLGTVLNSETFLSKMFGSITIREDSDFESSELAQARLVSLVSSGTIVESNTVVFSNFVEGANGECGIMAEDFVDFDELHPYRGRERVHRDTTTIAMVRAAPQANGNSAVIVVTRLTYLKIHNSNKDTSQNPKTELMESSVWWGDTTKKCIQKHLVSTVTLNDPQIHDYEIK